VTSDQWFMPLLVTAPVADDHGFCSPFFSPHWIFPRQGKKTICIYAAETAAGYVMMN
jgi:hypothetical protein